MRQLRRGRRSLAVLALAATLAACRGAADRRPEKPNVVFVLIDTLRADRVGWYGDDRRLTPFLDSLAAESTVYWRAYATASWTAPSLASLFTSRYPTQHRAIHRGSVLEPSETTLAESLAAHGYATAAFSAHTIFRGASRFGQGFAAITVLPAARRRHGERGTVEEVSAATLAWLDARPPAERERPLFLYLHFMEPHIPFAPPEEHLAAILARRLDPAAARTEAEEARAVLDGLGLVAPDRRAAVEDLYDAEVRHLDAGLAELFAALAERGILEHAVVVVTADHGEELFEHGRFGHGQTLYEEVLRVPLLVRSPGQRARVDDRRLTSLIDVAPTILALAGIPIPSSFEGRPLEVANDRGWVEWLRARLGHAPEVPGSSFGELYALVEPAGEPRPPARAVIEGDAKLILSPAGDEEGYRLDRDPKEHDTLGLSQDERMRLHDRLREFAARVARRARPSPATVDEGTRERLRALGYGD